MKKIYIARHGQTDMNAKGIWQGQSLDTPLNLEGRKQAHKLALALQDKNIEVIHSSPLIRAVETAEIISSLCSVPIIQNQGLNEGCCGIAEGHCLADIGEENIPLLNEWKNMDAAFLDVRFPQGESKREIQTRAINAILEIANSPYENIAVVTHSMVIRMILLYLGYIRQSVYNTEYFVLHFDEKGLKIAE